MFRSYGRCHRDNVPMPYDSPVIELDDSDGEDEDLGGTEEFVFGEERFSQEFLFSSLGPETQFESMWSGGGGAEGRKKRKGDWGKERVMVTLMETQESGEMMESVDEVNFALDGLRAGQQARVMKLVRVNSLLASS